MVATDNHDPLARFCKLMEREKRISESLKRNAQGGKEDKERKNTCSEGGYWKGIELALPLIEDFEREREMKLWCVCVLGIKRRKGNDK